MIKIAGGMILGFFGIIILCCCLHDCSGELKKNDSSENYTKATNKELAYECRNAFIEKLKNPSQLNFHVGNVTRLGFNNVSIIVIDVTNPRNPNQMAMIGCTIKQISNNEFETNLTSESYIGGIEKD